MRPTRTNRSKYNQRHLLQCFLGDVHPELDPESALHELISTLSAPLLRYADSWPYASADDLCQEVWVAFLNVRKSTIRKFETPRQLYALLFAILRRKMADAARGMYPTVPIEDMPFEPSVGHETVDSLIARDMERTCRKRLAGVPPDHRNVLYLHYYMNLRFSEIAEKLGISEVAARQRSFRGLSQLRKLMQEDGLQE